MASPRSQPAEVRAPGPLSGKPIRVRFSPDLRATGNRLRSGPGPGLEVHAGSHLRRRVIVLDSALLTRSRELKRILVHELFHFVWLRLGNPRRVSWKRIVAAEIAARAGGELGWSSEMRKRTLPHNPIRDTRRWRDYTCESFCDTAAWLYGGVRTHDEFTLGKRARAGRRQWFEDEVEGRPLRI